MSTIADIQAKLPSTYVVDDCLPVILIRGIVQQAEDLRLYRAAKGYFAQYETGYMCTSAYLPNPIKPFHSPGASAAAPYESAAHEVSALPETCSRKRTDSLVVDGVWAERDVGEYNLTGSRTPISS